MFLYYNNAYYTYNDGRFPILVNGTVTSVQDLIAQYTPTSALAAVATSGDYDDLSNKPTIPTALSDFGVTASASELNVLDGITASTAELNYTDGVTSNIQTQLDNRLNTNYTEISSATSIDDIRTLGFYALSNTTSGLPEGTNGVLWVFNSISDSTYIQIFRRHGTAGTNDQNLYIRRGSDVAWGSWVKFCGTFDTSYHLRYASGDTIVLDNMIFAGFLTSSAKNIWFFIPLPKDLSDITSASLSVDTSWEARHSDGGYLIQTAPLASYGSITCEVVSTGVRITVQASSATSFTNNAPVSVRAITATLQLT
jgi:hypothetical protein